MKTLKSKLLLAVTAVAMAVCLSFGLAACGGAKEFTAPENVKLQDGHTLVWDAVEEAESYTVKINTDETTTVKIASLDLNTVTAKLVEGENTLSVKVNGTAKKSESKYSATVKYTYAPEPVSTPFAKLTITLNGDTLSWAAVDGAANGYTVKIGESTLAVSTHSLDLTSDEATAVLVKGDNEISVKVNAAGNRTESVYSDAVTYNYQISSEVEAQAFVSAVNAIGEVTLTSEAAVKTAKAKYAVLSDEAKEVEGVTAAVTALTEKDGAYFALLAEAVPTVTATSTKAELESAKTAIDGALAYHATLIDATASATVKTALDGKNTAYGEVIAAHEATVAALAATINGMSLGGTIPAEKVNNEYYAELNGLLEEIDGLGDYPASLWDAALTKAVNDEITALLAIPKTTEDSVEAFVNGANGTVTILYKAVNILGEAIKGTAPALTVEIDDGTTNGVDTSAAAFTANNGVYYYTVNFTQKGDEDKAAAGYVLKVTYTIGGGEEQTVTYIQFHDDIYFNPPYNAILNGKIQFSGADGLEAYFDIYEASAITRGTSVPAITDFPLIKGLVVTNGMPVEDLRKQLACDEEYSKLLLDKTYEVRFVVYNKSVNGISNIKTDLVSADTYTLDLTEEDAKERISLGNAGTVIGTDGGVTIGAAYDADVLAAQFDDENVTAANVHEKLAYIVSVTLNGEVKRFTINCPQGGSISSSVMQTEIFKLFNNTTDSNYKIGLQLVLTGDAVEKYGHILRDSVIREYDWNVQLTLPDNTCQIRFAGSGFFEILRVGSSNGSVFNFGVECVELKIEKDGTSYSAYFFNTGVVRGNSTVLALYASKATDGVTVNGTGNADTALECDTIQNGYCTIDAFNNWMKNNMGAAADFNVQDGWEVSTKVHFDGDYGVTSDYSTPITYTAA